LVLLAAAIGEVYDITPFTALFASFHRLPNDKRTNGVVRFVFNFVMVGHLRLFFGADYDLSQHRIQLAVHGINPGEDPRKFSLRYRMPKILL
jgi:hypothetical protein